MERTDSTSTPESPPFEGEWYGSNWASLVTAGTDSEVPPPPGATDVDDSQDPASLPQPTSDGLPCIPRDVFVNVLLPMLPSPSLRKVCCGCRAWMRITEGSVELRQRLFQDRRWDSWDSMALPGRFINALRDAGYPSPLGVQCHLLVPFTKGYNCVGVEGKGAGASTLAAICCALRSWEEEEKEEGDVNPTALLLCPTRDTAAEAAAAVRRIMTALLGEEGEDLTVLFHGNSPPRDRGHRVMIGTPGRIAHWLRKLDSGTDFPALKLLALDGTDEMMWNGFGPEIRTIASLLPSSPQMLITSTTPPDPTQMSLAHSPYIYSRTNLVNFFTGHRFSYVVTEGDKMAAVGDLISQMPLPCIIFGPNKKRVEGVTHELLHRGHPVCLIHEDMPCYDRRKNLSIFMGSTCGIMCITYLCMRCVIDLSRIRTTIHIDPAEPETYVHCLAATAAPAGTDPRVSVFVLQPSDLHLLNHLQTYFCAQLDRIELQ